MKKCYLISACVLSLICILTSCNSVQKLTDAGDAVKTLFPGTETGIETESKIGAETQTETLVENTTESKTVPETEIDYTDLVENVYSYSRNFSDSGGNENVFYVDIPRVNLDSSEIDALNEEIYDRFMGYANDIETIDADAYYNIGCDKAYYTWYSYDGYLVLNLFESLYPDASGWIEPSAYTFDIANKRILQKSDLISYFQMEEDAYRKLVRDTLGNYFVTTYQAAIDNGYDPNFTRQQFLETVSEENIDYTKLFIGEDGKIMMICRIYALAGGNSYPHVVNPYEVGSTAYYEQWCAENGID